MEKSATRRVILVVGGSFGGLSACRGVRRELERCCANGRDVETQQSVRSVLLILVEPKDHFEWQPAALRCLVQPSHSQNTLIAIAPFLKGLEQTRSGGKHRFTLETSWIRDSVETLNEDHVILRNSASRVAFHACIIATGCSYAYPIRPQHSADEAHILKEHRQKEIRSWHDNLSSPSLSSPSSSSPARSLLIVGGGFVGVELAAEVEHYHKNVSVTLMTSHDRILDRVPLGMSKAAHQYLTTHGVRVILGTRSSPEDEDKYGLVVKCFGGTANSVFAQKSQSARIRDSVSASTRRISVDNWLRLSAHDASSEAGNQPDQEHLNTHIFAVGDVSELPFESGEKMSYHAVDQAAVAAFNALLVSQALPLNCCGLRMRKYPHDVAGAVPVLRGDSKQMRPHIVQVLSLGPHRAVLRVENFALGGSNLLTGGLAAVVKTVVEKVSIASFRSFRSPALLLLELMEVFTAHLAAFSFVLSPRRHS